MYTKLGHSYRLYMENDLPALYCDGFMENTYNGDHYMYLAFFTSVKLIVFIFVKLFDLTYYVLFSKTGFGKD